MRLRYQTASSSDTDLRMSAMIDIVFLLLIFFVMTFRIVPQEGDFSVRPSAEGVGAAATSLSLPLHVHLISDTDGSLSAVRFNGRMLASLDDLHASLIAMSMEGTFADATMSLECDAALKYDHVMSAMDAVTGYYDEADRFVPLVTNVTLVGAT